MDDNRTNLNQLTDCVLLSLIEKIGPAPPEPSDDGRKLWSDNALDLECVRATTTTNVEMTGPVIEMMESGVGIFWDKGSEVVPTSGSRFIDIEAVLSR